MNSWNVQLDDTDGYGSEGALVFVRGDSGLRSCDLAGVACRNDSVGCRLEVMHTVVMTSRLDQE